MKRVISVLTYLGLLLGLEERDAEVLVQLLVGEVDEELLEVRRSVIKYASESVILLIIHVTLLYLV
jgi:hypothetical protein|tara:strand:- start:316 stop:513 length:198 start_codon:yes stop_codon:yes gene_type:complete